MSAHTPNWEDTLRGPGHADEAAATVRAGRHREDADRRRTVVAAAACVGAGLAAGADAIGGSRSVLREVSPVPVDWLLLALAWALLVGGVGVLASLRRRRLLVPAWSIGGLFIGGGAYGMVEGFVRHTVLRTSSASSYWWCEALAAAVVVLGAWALRHPRAHSR